MGNLIKNLIKAAHQFNAVDFATFKICLIAIGILLGAYFSDFFMEYISVVAVIAIITFGVLLMQTVRYYKKP